jgi:hypothetical protein
MAENDPGQKVNVSFKKTVYSPRAVKRAVKEYSRFAEFELKEDGEYVHVTISGVEPEQMEELRGEFCNYALFLTK